LLRGKRVLDHRGELLGGLQVCPHGSSRHVRTMVILIDDALKLHASQPQAALCNVQHAACCAAQPAACNMLPASPQHATDRHACNGSMQ
jgi:hypothetical protein